MRKLTVLLCLFATACGAPAVTRSAAEAPQTSPLALASSTAPASTATISEAVQPSPTFFPTPTSIEIATPTETSLPPLALPSELANAPARLAWDGEPTYPGDSKPGYAFRLLYDPDIWALTTDSYGFPAIGHRDIEYCVIAPAQGHGLPGNVTTDHDVRKIGAVEFEISTIYLDGVRQLVTYIGGDANIYTGFEVSFKDESDRCIKDAETVLGTLTSVPLSQATPSP